MSFLPKASSLGIIPLVSSVHHLRPSKSDRVTFLKRCLFDARQNCAPRQEVNAGMSHAIGLRLLGWRLDEIAHNNIAEARPSALQSTK